VERWQGQLLCSHASQGIGIVPKVLLNVLNEKGQISRSHGIPASILQAQAAAMGLPVKMIASSWKDYESNFTDALTVLKNEHNLTHAIFGDIDLDEHKNWEEKVCARPGLIALLPLWKMDRKNLVLRNAGTRELKQLL
jgi:diphthamide synthase (EF-2-diphthine--ammonia ligase)